MSNIGERVKAIIAKHLGVERDKVTDDANFVDDLGADSLDTVELAMSFEDEFGCEFPEEAAVRMFTVGDVLKFLETNAKGDNQESRLPEQ
jgi:acyl carrier protein